jgi:hypothetical protein
MRDAPAPDTLRLPLGQSEAQKPSRASKLFAAALVAGAIAVALSGRDARVRAVVACGLVALAAALHQGSLARKSPPRGWLVVDHDGAERETSEGASRLFRWNEPFGLTLFASADRSGLLLAVTSPSATRMLLAYRRADDGPLPRMLLEHAATVSECDLPRGDEAALGTDDATKLLVEVMRRAPAALERVYLSDANGEPLVLDRAELRIGPRRVDLLAPLEWRASCFQERGTHAASVCQATWVKQDDVEVVLVAPMPGDGLGTRRAGGWLKGGDDTAASDLLARDVRLMQASAGDPPPRDLRMAIDHLFMLPIRRALDAAPRAPKARPSFDSLRDNA